MTPDYSAEIVCACRWRERTGAIVSNRRRPRASLIISRRTRININAYENPRPKTFFPYWCVLGPYRFVCPYRPIKVPVLILTFEHSHSPFVSYRSRIRRYFSAENSFADHVRVFNLGTKQSVWTPSIGSYAGSIG